VAVLDANGPVISGVLIERDEHGVGNDVHDFGAQIGEVNAQEQRALSEGPESEVALLLHQ